MPETKLRKSGRARRPKPARPGSYLHATLSLLEQKWTLAIVMALLKGKRRFTELAEGTPGLNTRTLSERLRNLEKQEIVERHEVEASRRNVEYSLTEKGKELRTVLRSIARWGRRWLETGPS